MLKELTSTGLYGYSAESTAHELFSRALREELRRNGWVAVGRG